MRCERPRQRAAFADLSRPLIEGREAEHTVLFSALRLGSPESAEPDLMVVVLDGESPRLAAAQRAPFSLVLSEGDVGAIPFLVGEIAEAGHALPGVYGPGLLAERFSLAWCLHTGVTAAKRLSMTMLKLTEPVRPLAAPGGFRRATAADLDPLADWSELAAAEMGLSQAEIDGARDGTIKRVADGAMYLWEDDGQPVSMAGFTVTDPRGRAGRINMVYTPPEARRRGYAGACVSTLSHNLLLAGWAYCLIAADEANATTSALYRRIGFDPVGRFCDHLFTG